MAAPKETVRHTDSDSEDEDDDLERFKEATWELPGAVEKVSCKQKGVPSAMPSSRVRPDCHEHDGNELQTTPEFRSYVAKKLTAILDSSIKEIPGSRTLQEKPMVVADTEDDGFRLFGTSLPGNPLAVTPSIVPKRRVASSSSEDSEEETQKRCREAAVSAADILKHSALKQENQETSDIVCDTQPCKKKKKKKKKREVEIDTQQEETQQQECVKNGPEVKRKKKKKQRSEES
ncbi:protein CUSTOS [Rhinophrynus dorsalis]